MHPFANAKDNKAPAVTAAGSGSFDLEDIVEAHKGVSRTRRKRQAMLRATARICRALRASDGRRTRLHALRCALRNFGRSIDDREFALVGGVVHLHMEDSRLA